VHCRVAGKLPTWQARELEATGVRWKVSDAEMAWHQQFHLLRHFKALFGHTQLSTDSLAQRRGDAVAAAAPSSSSNIGGSGASSADWSPTAQWLEQQQELARLQKLPLSKAKMLHKLREQLTAAPALAVKQQARALPWHFMQAHVGACSTPVTVQSPHHGMSTGCRRAVVGHAQLLLRSRGAVGAADRSSGSRRGAAAACAALRV
jgi:hypothetical protein